MSSGSKLEGSWVVNDGDESDISWDENDASDEAEPTFKRPHKVPQSPRDAKARKRTPRTSSIQPEPELVMPSIGEYPPKSTTTNPGSRSQLRQRGTRPITAVPGSQAQSKRSPTHQPRSSTTAHDATTNIMDKLTNILLHTAEWVLDILGSTLKALKKPISWVLAAYFFAGLLTLTQNLLTSSIYTALSPICRIPGVSLLSLPICHYTPQDPNQPTLPSSSTDSPPVEFDALMSTQSQFEDVLASSASGVSLPLDMKRSETSIRDLRQIVRFSSIPSKNELVLEFDGFIETARIASYDLQKFNSHVGRGVDIVLSTARWTQRVLDDMAHQQSHSRGGIMPAFLSNTLLAPFQPLRFTEDRLLDQYIQHTHIISAEIETLIAEAQALLLVLQNLEDRLDVIHAIALRDHVLAQGSKDEVLAQLWTLLGGNRAQLGKYNNQMKLLRQVGEYRKIAWAHVSGTILKLQAMGAELEELRTRVGSAELERDAGVVGKKGRRRDRVPLSVHVESIRLGVERLEMGREKAREVERGHVRRVIDAGGGGGGGGAADGEHKWLVDA